MRQCCVLVGLLLLGCEQSPEETGPAPSDAVRMSVAWSVEPGSHDAADSLADISGITADQRGNVYASDWLAAKVWVFDSEGSFRGSAGRRGQGPGELEYPTGAGVGPDGRLYVRNVYQVVVFGEDPATGLLTRYEESYTGPTYPDWTSRRPTRFAEDGDLWFPGEEWLDDGTGEAHVISFDVTGNGGDTIRVPTYDTAPQVTAFYRLSGADGRMLFGLAHVPMAPVPDWDIAPDGVTYSGDGASYEIIGTDATGVVSGSFGRTLPRVEIPDGQFADSAAALRSRLDSIPVSLDDVEGLTDEVRSVAMPTHYPAFMAIHVSTDDRVWVRRWPVADADESIFDVFERNGEFVHTVVLPRAILKEPAPILSAGRVIGLTTHPLTDEPIILAFEPEGDR